MPQPKRPRSDRTSSMQMVRKRRQSLMRKAYEVHKKTGTQFWLFTLFDDKFVCYTSTEDLPPLSNEAVSMMIIDSY